MEGPMMLTPKKPLEEYTDQELITELRSRADTTIFGFYRRDRKETSGITWYASGTTMEVCGLTATLLSMLTLEGELPQRREITPR